MLNLILAAHLLVIGADRFEGIPTFHVEHFALLCPDGSIVVLDVDWAHVQRRYRDDKWYWDLPTRWWSRVVPNRKNILRNPRRNGGFGEWPGGPVTKARLWEQ